MKQRVSKQAKLKIAVALDMNEKFKRAYFMNPPRAASQRRAMEKENDYQAKFVSGGKVYEIYMSVTCSCNNVYFNKCIKVDGKVADIRALKRLLK